MADPIIEGKDFNFYKLVSVSSASFSSAADAKINFRGEQCFSLLNYGSGNVEYSFNGNTVHGELRFGTPSAGIIFDNRRISKIWLRMKGGGTAEVRIEAWAKV
jgi:hypothetical protein